MPQKRVYITRHGKSSVLEVRSTSIPEPEPGQVRIKVLTAGVSFADVMKRDGIYPGSRLPFVPGFDVVGIVDKVGEGVFDIKQGETVAVLTNGEDGYSEYVCTSQQEIAPVPAGVDAAEAVSLILNYLTAYQMLHRIAKVKRGQNVLIHNAAGGVGSALLQLGRLEDLKMYGTASKGKHALVRELGGIPIDYRNEDVTKRVMELTEDGVDYVFEGMGYQWWPSYRLLRKKGMLITYGLGGLVGMKRFHLVVNAILHIFTMVMMKLIPDGRKATLFSLPLNKARHPEWIRDDLTKLFELLKNNDIKPVISERLPLDEAAKAHELLESGQTHGKIVLTCA